jgi:prepilin-type N-terminal cleavage/methylation domain-containing protein
MLLRWLGKKGFTLVEIMIVVGVIAVLLSMAIPAFVEMRTRANARICIANLKRISLAKEMWAVANTGNDPLWSDLVPDHIKSRPECPVGGEIIIGDMDTAPTCSIPGHRIE